MKKPIFISDDLWSSLSRKEQDYIIFKQKWFKKNQLMRKLYISTRQGFLKFEKNIVNKIKNDVNKVYKI